MSSLVFFFSLNTLSAEQVSIQLLSHEESVKQANLGQFDLAIQSLKHLHQQDNFNQRVLYDLVTVLQWSGNDHEAWRYGATINLAKAPDYVVAALGRAARNQRHYDDAVKLFRLAQKQFPQQADFVIALAMTFSDVGKYEQGLEVIDKVMPQFPDHVGLLFARGYILERQKKLAEAALYYLIVLKHGPEHTDAMRNLVRVVNNSGASGLAHSLVNKNPEVIQPSYGQQVMSDRGAQWIRWGKVSNNQKVDRFEDTDKAIKFLENIIHRSEENGGADSNQVKQSRYNYIVALRHRYRMQDVVIQYETLKKQGAGIPGYALHATADAYLYLEQPEQARDLYKQVLAKNTNNFDANMGLFYAYVDAEQHDLAHNEVLHLSQTVPKVRRNELKGIVSGVDEALTVDISLGLADSFAGRHDQAQHHLEALSRKAPMNTDIRKELANVYLSRGWPRHAMKEVRIGLSTETNHTGLKLALANSLMQIDQLRAADVELKRLVKMYPEDKDVQRVQRFRSVRNKREFILLATGGKASGGPNGSKDSTVESRLYSQPINYDFRAFVIGRYSDTQFDTGGTQLKRAGVGIEYRYNGLNLTTGVTHNDYEGTDTALFVEISKWMNDHWNLAASFDQFSTDVPADALNEGLGAKSASLSASYRAAESRQYNLKLGAMEFDDDNRRRMLSIGWKERWISGPRFILTTFLDFDTSTNSQNNTAYFNPEEDRSFALTVQNTWLVSRHYDHSFYNVLALGAGNYWQRDFSNDDTWTLSYEHQWNRIGSGLSYGISRARHPYDGVQEYETRFFLNYNISW